MMERLLGVAEVAERYHCCHKTASKRMKQMVHMEKPLLVSENAIMQWEWEHTVTPGKKELPLSRVHVTEMKMPRRRA